MNRTLFLSLLLTPLFLFVHKAEADIIVIKVKGVVNPVMAEFISDNINDAVENSEELFIIQLDTPGGLDASMRTIVKKIKSSSVPVAVYVAPSGARAASAGVFITISAHIAAMAPGTNIGAAHPVGVGGKMDDAAAEKAVNDAAAYIRSLAEERGRNAEWSEKAVRESVSITAQEALKLNVTDYTANNLNSLLDSIDGETVKTAAGMQRITTEGIHIQYREKGVRSKVLDVISDPNVAYLLMMLGFYGIFFELTNPGAIFPGVLGAMFLILALFAFQTLPVNYAGLMLIILGIVLFILEIKVASYGMLTIGGIVSLVIGSLMLFDSPQPFFQISLKILLPAVALTSLFFSLTVYLAVRAFSLKPVTGSEGLTGLAGTAKTDILKDGQVFVHGEIWRAWSDEPIKAGDSIIVESMENLKLKVRSTE